MVVVSDKEVNENIGEKNYENWKKGNKNKPPLEPNVTVLEKRNSLVVFISIFSQTKAPSYEMPSASHKFWLAIIEQSWLFQILCNTSYIFKSISEG